MFKILLIFSLFFGGFFAHSKPLQMSDLSVLLPLPATQDWDLLLQPTTQAEYGVLLPQNDLEQLPTLVQGLPNADLLPDFRVIGFRVDPCFAEGPTPLECKKQIRLIWQALANVNGNTSTIDVALHSFYELSNSEFTQLIRELRSLKETSADADTKAALSVNPIIQKEGLNGAYYKKLVALIKKNIGEKNLSRITFMQLFANQTVWFFGGLDITNSSVQKIVIPRINKTLQQFINTFSPGHSTEFIGGIFPTPKNADNVNIITEDSRKLTLQNEEQIVQATRSAFKFENPNLNNPGTLDCVSCHVAQITKFWALKNFDTLKLEQLSQDLIYQSDKNLNNLSPLKDNMNIVRIFGYFNDQAIVAQRAINESAAALNFVEKNY